MKTIKLLLAAAFVTGTLGGCATEEKMPEMSKEERLKMYQKCSNETAAEMVAEKCGHFLKSG